MCLSHLHVKLVPPEPNGSLALSSPGRRDGGSHPGARNEPPGLPHVPSQTHNHTRSGEATRHSCDVLCIFGTEFTTDCGIHRFSSTCPSSKYIVSRRFGFFCHPEKKKRRNMRKRKRYRIHLRGYRKIPTNCTPVILRTRKAKLPRSIVSRDRRRETQSKVLGGRREASYVGRAALNLLQYLCGTVMGRFYLIPKSYAGTFTPRSSFA